MVQVLEKREMEYELIIIPAKEEKVKEEVKEVKKKKSLKKHAKQHEALIKVQRLKNKVYGNISGYKDVPY